MALDKFVNCTNDLLDFEIDYSKSAAENNIHSLEVLRVELDSLWSQVKRAYEECRDTKEDSTEKPIDKNKLRDRYKKGLSAYKICLGAINAEIQVLSNPSKEERISAVNNPSLENDDISFVRLPPCDTDTFYGDFVTWPTFRDLFTALYIKNSRLSKIEKLFHLIQKTEGDARKIVSNAPLTNEGFDIAWKNRVAQYENKRIQVNEQLKILFDLPNVTEDSGSSIQNLQRTVNGCIQALNALGVETGTWDPFLVYLCSTKLPRTLLKEFENSLQEITKVPTWEQFNTFLTHNTKTLESIAAITQSNTKSNQHRKDNSKPFTKPKRVHTFQTNTTQENGSKNKKHFNSNRTQKNDSNYTCQQCKESHHLWSCPKFLEQNVNDRIHTVRVTNSCYNCLSVDHSVRDCKSKYSCRLCNQRHNTLLHKGSETQSTVQNCDATRPSTSSAAQNNNIQSTPNSNVSIPNLTTLTLQESKLFNQSPNERETLLFTAIVQIETRGERYQARAIIDPGSQSTFMSEKLKNRLNLPTKRNLVHVTGLSQTVSETSTKACLFNLCSKVDSQFKLEVWAPVLKTLPSNLPPQTLDLHNFNETAKLELADPHFNQSRPIDMLIGLDLGPSIYCMDTPMRSIGSLLAQKTVFGWIVGGPIPTSTKPRTTVSLVNTSSLDRILTRFWEVEETPKQVLRSDEDTFCENNFMSTTRRNNSGRYIVTLPFKNSEEIGTSRNIAMAQFLRMERMLSQKPELKKQYDQVIVEYIELGHMRKVSPLEINTNPNYYLPHHAVIKPERLTTKLRVVFNASSPSSNKKSLNDILYPGPILQQDLVLLILKWRFFRFVYNADITKMYRQILIDPTQTKYQRILFRKSENDPIEDFELLTVTFGVNCAPFLAIRTILQLAEDVKSTHPLASKILQQNMYVDDVLAGGHTLNDAIKSRKELTTVLKSAGFDLMKWTSNDPRVIQDLPNETLLPLDWLNLSENTGTKTLGIKWNISSDSFTFTAPDVELKENYTKREVLSTIAKFFDPCGWIAPIIVEAKLIMQQIWLDKVDWDDILKSLTCLKWQKFIKNCPTINTLKIPRWIQFSPNCNVEIHGFSDASEKAYSATLYARIESENSVFTFLLASKTRVAPIKQISLPRLELCGSVLLANLACGIIPNLQIQNVNTYYWTDSTIVLSWLKKPPCSWNTFVGNRVSEILDKVGNQNWQHIDSKDNPADIASRGCSPQELGNHNLWWFGPSWLKLHKNQWPKQIRMEDTNLEAKTVKAFTTTTSEELLNRFSNLSRAYRVLAYVMRFWRNTGTNRTHLRISSAEITREEIESVKNRLIKWTQQNHFPDEHKNLKLRQKISPNSSLLTLNPFMDRNGIIRANGRLAQSPALTYNERYPILLPHNSKLSRLLVEFTHKITLHGGNQLMIRVLRTEYWIFRLKPLVKSVIHNCKTCVLYKKQTQNQIMASLPPERTTLSRPFAATGVDYAGPFDIKNFTGRACLITKGYICIFVCFATKAVHLEAASDLSTQSFLAAFSRFIGRRGCPAHIYSDNGKNFVGAAEFIRKERLDFIKTLQNQVTQHFSHQNIDWKFIPPGAPHMGGLWEAGVKSFKTHLKKMIPNMKFTFEELSTILTRIESCLNSRPLSPASDDPNDLNPLTPGHFLIGTPLLTPAEPDVSSENLTLINRWKRLKVIYHSFCQRWKSEYLAELHRRYKWKIQRDNVKVNDLVVIKNNNLPPNEWQMGMASQQPQRPEHWQFSCGICLKDHPIRTCKKFLSYNPTERYEIMVVKKYCLNCLARSHKTPECKSDNGCHICKRSHNTLLHDAKQLAQPSIRADPQPSRRADPQPSRRADPQPSSRAEFDTPFFNQNLVFIPTASVRIYTENIDTWISTRAIINRALTTSRISKSFVTKYKIKTFMKYAHNFAVFEIRSHSDKNKWSTKVTALVTDQLPRKPYSGPITADPTEDFPPNTLADIDPQSNTIAEIEIGSDVYPTMRRDGAIQTEVGQVVAEKSALGYLFSGPIQQLW
ncbi:uncharacterized protein LOC135949022 [Calliphora vicina]|uniref:uncharacterized protein LOC135949022 n=1 Tax=Calliphora vicina TaxID=7373 RepID=UPI00325AF822